MKNQTLAPNAPHVNLRPRPQVAGYFRIRNFFFPDTATGRKQIRSPEWKKYIRNESDNVWTR